MYRSLSSSLHGRAAVLIRRSVMTRRSVQPANLSPAVLEVMPPGPGVTLEANPQAEPRNPVSSAHMIVDGAVSVLDSAVVTPDGSSAMHGRYGPLDSVEAVPLEYLALLRPAAQGAAALRSLGGASSGTVVVFGASRASGLAAAQLAAADGLAVVAVVDAAHAANEDALATLKGMIPEPGTVVPEEYAISKAAFRDLVQAVVTGEEGIAAADPEAYLQDFYQNLEAYSEAFPDTRPAAVEASVVEFNNVERDAENWDVNMETYLAQYPAGAPPLDTAKLQAVFSSQQYQIFREKFWEQTTAVITDDAIEKPFSPPHIVQELIQQPGTPIGSTTDLPYSFNIFTEDLAGTAPAPAGPVVGAILEVTPDLAVAVEALSAAKTTREKAEKLQFLTHAQRAAHAAAASVVAQAQASGAPVVVIVSEGGKMWTDMGMQVVDTAAVTDADVQTALKAMDVDEQGASALNYFVQTYRAADFPFYADYAVHRSKEAVAGPRQIIVTK